MSVQVGGVGGIFNGDDSPYKATAIRAVKEMHNFNGIANW
jgi:hypothetical protein